MKYRRFTKVQNKDISVLGFETSSLTLIQNKTKIDKETARLLITTAFKEGINLFNSSYNYKNKDAESVLGDILKEENLRDKVFLSNSSPISLITEESDFQLVFHEQLKRLKTEYIDFYSLEISTPEDWSRIKSLHGLQFLEKHKRSGLIKHIGFSFKGNFDYFKTIIDEYQNWDFCEVEFNYLKDESTEDSTHPGWQGVAYAGRKSVGVIISNPFNGGILANPPRGILPIFANASVPRIPAEWALRFVLESQDVVTTIAGMKAIDQVLIDCGIASSSAPNSLPKSQLEVIEKAKEWLEANS